MPNIARILLLSGIACFAFSEEASATFYCNKHHNCPNDGRYLSTADSSKASCKRRGAASWGNGPASPHNTCENLN
jgi:hypothetical protein